MTEAFVSDLLQHELDARKIRLESLDVQISVLRNRSTRTTNKKDYILYKTELDNLESERRNLRGEISALRQAIKKLERSD